jgi:hypothetical protein
MHPWTTARDEAQRLAKIDTNAALSVARTIQDAWYKAQALAWVGFFCKSGGFRNILEEARIASWSLIDPYRIVGSSAWRLRAWIERGESGAASGELPDLLVQAEAIEHPVSRLEALTLLLAAVNDLDEARQRVLDAQIKAAAVAQSWRSGARLRDSAIMLAWARYGDDAARVVASMPDGKYKRQAMQGIAESKRLEFRPFFW